MQECLSTSMAIMVQLGLLIRRTERTPFAQYALCRHVVLSDLVITAVLFG
jgi:hypothetical protein